MIKSWQDFVKEKKSALPELKTWQDISRKGTHTWEIQAVTFMPQSSMKEKLLMIQRLKHKESLGTHAYPGGKKGRIEYRIGYYMLGQIGNRKGKWTWGESAPLLPHKDLFKLMELAKREGTIL